LGSSESRRNTGVNRVNRRIEEETSPVINKSDIIESLIKNSSIHLTNIIQDGYINTALGEIYYNMTEADFSFMAHGGIPPVN
jgi:hypothetical protein